jgi:hypothetical protein
MTAQAIHVLRGDARCAAGSEQHAGGFHGGRVALGYIDDIVGCGPEAAVRECFDTTQTRAQQRGLTAQLLHVPTGWGTDHPAPEVCAAWRMKDWWCLECRWEQGSSPAG